MTDVIDKASEIEQQQTAQAIAACRSTEETPYELNGHRFCLDCGIELTTARLLAMPNAVRDIDCQVLHERDLKHYRQGRK